MLRLHATDLQYVSTPHFQPRRYEAVAASRGDLVEAFDPSREPRQMNRPKEFEEDLGAIELYELQSKALASSLRTLK